MTVRVITKKQELIAWLAEQVVRAEPQIETSTALIGIFDDIIRSFQKYSMLHPWAIGSEFFCISYILSGSRAKPYNAMQPWTH
ncbi:hypothetical protein GGR00_004130 [Aminobacter aganoensis]|uniref:Uncharacterized protein n=1 Tax=Aminobacter aganoensis TaxID=83264 RepID=A0A7X0KMN4_9HYPH|nr:hypothetical protein [Aminobacter aganoensis]MBB6356322.1 hypothetical protein [Aminobacter aganoensis]